jgi:CMP-N,N'-diacetyllegionaminic acid synthase
MKTKTLALVVARGGSKGIPRKNLCPLGGHPLIAHTVLAAKASRLVDRTLLSTDDPEIADVGEQYGADVPFLRPTELARDDSRMVDVALHALEWLETREGYSPDHVLLLQPTSPFRTAEDIDAAIRMAHEGHPAVVSVCEARRHPCLAKRLDPDGSLHPFFESDFQSRRRQELPPAYDLNGAIYLVRREVLCTELSWCPRGARPYVMPPERSIDIDSPWDLQVANLIASPSSGRPAPAAPPP